MTQARLKKNLFIITGLLSTAGLTPAYALDEIYSPNIEYHELSYEYSGSFTFDSQADKNAAIDHSLVVEAGITEHWLIEGSTGFSKSPANKLQVSDYEVETRYEFAQPGEYWMDSGILVAYGFAAQSQAPDAVEVKLLLQKDFGRFTSTANIGFSQDIGTYSAHGGPDYVFLMNTRYRHSEKFQPGIELQSDFGQRDNFGHYNQQEHYLGPMIYGRVFHHLHYEVGYLYGISDAAAHNAARLKLEYETYF